MGTPVAPVWRPRHDGVIMLPHVYQDVRLLGGRVMMALLFWVILLICEAIILCIKYVILFVDVHGMTIGGGAWLSF